MKIRKPLTVADAIQALERRAPSGTAESWDNVGLLLGDPAWETSSVVACIDLSEEALATARKLGARLIVNHHPIIFPKGKGVSRIVAGSAGTSRLVFEALRAGIAVAACHTNFDRCALEVVDAVAEGLGLVPRGRLLDPPSAALTKLVVFVPEAHVEAVRAAICAAGAGQIGGYDSCTFSVNGEGTFRGGDDARPFIGAPGKFEKVGERRLETIFPSGLQKPVLAAMRAAHPYEEVAFDLYAVQQSGSPRGLVRGLGYGFWGEFPKPRPFAEVRKDVTRLFGINGFLLTDSPRSRIQRIAYAAGKGASFVESAAAQGCELMITGEAGYHTALDGSRRGMAIMEIGHRESEKFFPRTMKAWLTEAGFSKVVTLDVATQKFASG